MAKLTLDDLRKLRDEKQKAIEKRDPTNKDAQIIVGMGTCVSFTLDARHLDTPPFGDLPETFLGLMTFGGSYDLILTRTTPNDNYTVSRGELIDTLGNLEEIDNLILARAYVRSQEENLNL